MCRRARVLRSASVGERVCVRVCLDACSHEVPFCRRRLCHFARWRSTAQAITSVKLRAQCWAKIQQLALIGSSSSLYSEACNGTTHSGVSLEAASLRVAANKRSLSLGAVTYGLWLTTGGPSCAIVRTRCTETFCSQHGGPVQVFLSVDCTCTGSLLQWFLS